MYTKRSHKINKKVNFMFFPSRTVKNETFILIIKIVRIQCNELQDINFDIITSFRCENKSGYPASHVQIILS